MPRYKIIQPFCSLLSQYKYIPARWLFEERIYYINKKVEENQYSYEIQYDIDTIHEDIFKPKRIDWYCKNPIRITLKDPTG